VLYPLGILFNIGVRTEDGAPLANYRSVLTEPGLVSALIILLIVSAATTVLSLIIALPMAWAVSAPPCRPAAPPRCGVIAFVIPNFISVIAGSCCWAPMPG
jgi:ABC-type spermidine/putrescine transport system permease subunit I